MARIERVDPETAEGAQKELLDGMQKKIGMVPNLARAMANSPATLQAYLGFGAALSGGSLSAKLREQIALTVAETNGCEYCLAAHSAVGKSLGLSQEEITDARRGFSSNTAVEAALIFARQIVEARGWVSDDDLQDVRAAGFGDAEISEIVANVAVNLFSNYFNHVAQTPVDFPKVDALTTAAK